MSITIEITMLTVAALIVMITRVDVENIPRTATAQLNAATIVSNPQPGDLVFTVSGGIATHVGIYTGPGMMIDSPRTGKATSERAIFSGNVYGRF